MIPIWLNFPLYEIIKSNLMEPLIKSSPSPRACGGIFRNHKDFVRGVFICFIREACALKVELWGVVFAPLGLEALGWRSILLDCDTTFVIIGKLIVLVMG